MFDKVFGMNIASRGPMRRSPQYGLTGDRVHREIGVTDDEVVTMATARKANDIRI